MRFGSGSLARRSGHTLQILVEPLDRAPDRVDPIFARPQTMAFVRIVVRVDGLLVLLENLHDLCRLFLGHAQIVIALPHQQRRFDRVNTGEGLFSYCPT
jgi:hypothetical protein